MAISMALKDLWVAVLKRIKPTIKKANFITWFNHTTVIDKKDGTIIVGVPTTFAYGTITAKYSLKIFQALQEIDSNITKVEYEICGRLADKTNKEGVNIKDLLIDDETKTVKKSRGADEVVISRGKGHVSSQMLNEKYKLDNFIVGKDNRLPHAACCAISNAPGGIYNPLYIFGKTGLGKTHLLQAIGNEILKNYPDMVVQYITAEKFVTEIVEAITKRYAKSFKDKYRNVDCFLVDDIQFFARKHSSQQEFFHTFNALHDRNKQIVLTSDRPPSELDDLDARLKSRFSMGMVVELLSPDFETRLAILNAKCREFEVLIDPEVLNFIANNVHTNVRELEGVLRQAIAESELADRVPTIRSVAEVIKRLNKAQKIIGYDTDAVKDKMIARSCEDVMKAVAEYYRLALTDLTGNDRHKEYMLPRQVCMYLIKNELEESYEKIGRTFGGRNHTTIMHACNKTAKRLKKDIRLVRDVNSIKSEMGL